jgi:WD40 repeat protein
MKWLFILLAACWTFSLSIHMLIAKGSDTLCTNIIDSYAMYYRETSPSTITVRNFSVSPDGENMLISSPVGLYMYDARTLLYQETIRCGDVSVFAWSPDGAQFATFVTPCVGVEIWDTQTKTVQQALPTPEDSPYCADPFPEEPYVSFGALIQIAWSSDGHYLATHGNGIVPTRIWNLEFSTVALTFASDEAGELSWSPDGMTLAYVKSTDCVVREWKVGFEEFVPLFATPCPAHQPPFYFGHKWISWSSTNQIAVANVQSLYFGDGDTGGITKIDGITELSGITWNPDGTTLAAIVSPEVGELVHQISESEGYNDAPQAYQCGNTPHL